MRTSGLSRHALVLRAALWLALAPALFTASGCHTVEPNWEPNQAVLPWAEFQGSEVTVHNIRNTSYRTAEDYDVHHYDKTFDLTKLDEVTFNMVPLENVPGGAHTFLSFGFEGQDYVAISVEVRREDGEHFDAARSLVKPYKLMYVVGDERDLIQLRSIYWLEDVYMYPITAPREKMQAVFADMLKRANKLKRDPEDYNLVTNNCTTNIVRHVNTVAPNKIPYTYQIMFPAYSDRLAYELGLIQTDTTFEQTKNLARVNEVAYINRDSPRFSQHLRETGLLARSPTNKRLSARPPERQAQETRLRDLAW